MSKLLCVYCSSSDRLDPKYYAAADELGRAMVAHGWGLVYGGGRVGMMGAIARSVKSAGGSVVGVIPEFMVAKELAYNDADELIRVQTMRERKAAMEQRAAAFVALPGGWGTLEEILEIITLRQLDVLRKPCIFLNQDGFYDELLALFHKMIDGRFNRPSNLELFSVARTPDEVIRRLESDRHPVAETKWFVTT